MVDGAATTTAELYWPYGLTYDGDSVVYFSDSFNHSIRKLNVNTHQVTTIAGNGTSGLVDGVGSAARFYNPDGVAYQNGYLYIGDNMNNCIRKIDLSTNMVTTIAGTGTAGYQDGAAAQAMFRGGNGIDIVVDKNGDLYVADGSNAVIRKISGGIVSTFAGTPGAYGFVNGPASTAKFHRPRYLALDTSNGAIYTTDINNNVIRKIYNGNVSTFSGTGTAGATDGPANTATFNAPVGIAMTFDKHFYIVDGGGNKLRKMDSTGYVTTIAGNGVFGFQNGPAASAEFYYPQGVCYDKHCYIYIADRNNNRIRSVFIPEGPAGCSTAGIQDAASPIPFKSYPNPSSGYLTIENPIEENCSYKLINSIGQDVQSGVLISGVNRISLSSLPEGIYMLAIQQMNGTYVSRINIKR
jgi:hypothetical protein